MEQALASLVELGVVSRVHAVSTNPGFHLRQYVSWLLPLLLGEERDVSISGPCHTGRTRALQVIAAAALTQPGAGVEFRGETTKQCDAFAHDVSALLLELHRTSGVTDRPYCAVATVHDGGGLFVQYTTVAGVSTSWLTAVSDGVARPRARSLEPTTLLLIDDDDRQANVYVLPGVKTVRVLLGELVQTVPTTTRHEAATVQPDSLVTLEYVDDVLEYADAVIAG